jgi:uncharacterized protein (TIGR03067 family)
MARFAHAIAFPVLIAAGLVAGEDAARKDLKLLQGAWVMVALEVNGADVPIEKLQGTVLTIKDNSYVVKIKDKIINTALIELDPAKDPKHFNMTPQEGSNKDKLHPAIYKIDGETFKMARGLNPEQERPNQFATWPGTNYFVVTWKRQVP